MVSVRASLAVWWRRASLACRVSPRDLRQYCRYCRAVLPPARAPTPCRAKLWPGSQPAPVQQRRDRRRAGPFTASLQRVSVILMRASQRDRRRCQSKRARRGARRCQSGSSRSRTIADQGERGAGARSASRWQYCQAVSAVLPEVARRASARARPRAGLGLRPRTSLGFELRRTAIG